MSSAVIGFIAKLIAGAIWDDIQKRVFKPDPNPVDAILGGQQRIINLIEELDYKSQIREPMNLIYYWTKRMQEIVDDLNGPNSNAESLRAYQELLDALRNESAGVRFQTYRLYVAVMGDKSPLGQDGLLAFWEQGAYNKLADAGNMRYFMQDYIDELDNDIAAIFALLYHGLSLSFFVAAHAVDAENLKAECVTRVDTIRETLFKAYPPAIRQFKPNGYDDAGDFLTSLWFNFYREDDNTGKYYLTIYDFFCRQLGADGPKGPQAKIRSFRFVGEKALLGALQMHTFWLDRGNSRVKFYDDIPGTSRTFCYTNTLSAGKTYGILFKLIPLHVDNTTRTPIRLVPFSEDSLSPTRADKNNTFGNVFRLEVTTNPQ